jgi:hypothetical protein
MLNIELEMPILRTLALSGRQGRYNAGGEIAEACPLQGLLRQPPQLIVK